MEMATTADTLGQWDARRAAGGVADYLFACSHQTSPAAPFFMRGACTFSLVAGRRSAGLPDVSHLSRARRAGTLRPFQR
jgi:hypothetical protein